MIDYPPLPKPADHQIYNNVIPLPIEIRPELCIYRVEVLFFGLRQLVAPKRVEGDKSIKLPKGKEKTTTKLELIERPRVEIDIGNYTIKSEPIDDYGQHQNFTTQIVTMNIVSCTKL